jgi:hypothetical protein
MFKITCENTKYKKSYIPDFVVEVFYAMLKSAEKT